MNIYEKAYKHQQASEAADLNSIPHEEKTQFKSTVAFVIRETIDNIVGIETHDGKTHYFLVPPDVDFGELRDTYKATLSVPDDSVSEENTRFFNWICNVHDFNRIEIRTIVNPLDT